MKRNKVFYKLKLSFLISFYKASQQGKKKNRKLMLSLAGGERDDLVAKNVATEMIKCMPQMIK